MIICRSIAPLQGHLDNWRQQGSIGFVPTMGALHPGHVSLLEAARNGGDIVVASIFVNPAQFNDPSDFEKYPVTIEKDILLLERSGCDILFLPSVQEMYPDGFSAPEHYDLGHLDTVLEGKYRPGHFQGVCRVVKRLLDIVNPDRMYLGQKDYQQCMVIRRLIGITGKKTRLVICPTVREKDGLAMSSRNMRLSADDRAIAPAIYAQLEFCKKKLRAGPLGPLQQEVAGTLASKGFMVDYFAFADGDTLQPVDHWDGNIPLVALVAVFLHDVRLIDNLRLFPF